MEQERKTLLRVRDLRQWFPIKKWFFEKPAYVKAVDGVSFDLREGETLGVAGESGCGKSTMIRSVLRLIEPTGGTLDYDGRDITHLGGSDMRELRRNMQIVFQDPYSSLDSRWTVGAIIEEPMIINRMFGSAQERKVHVAQLMRQVGLPESYVGRYPHEFSGGQRQRVAIARALATNPRLLMCDEAVSALDVSVRAQILNLLEELQQELKLTYVFVSHDLSVIEHICDRVAIMYLGRIVELGTKDQIFGDCRHPYTKALLSAIPTVDDGARRERILLEGNIPSPVDPPEGCRFHTRCPEACEACRQDQQMIDVGDGHLVCCWRCTEREEKEKENLHVQR